MFQLFEFLDPLTERKNEVKSLKDELESFPTRKDREINFSTYVFRSFWKFYGGYLQTINNLFEFVAF